MSLTSFKKPCTPSNYITNDLSALRDCTLPMVNRSTGQIDEAWDRYNYQMSRAGRDADVLSQEQKRYLETTILESLQWESMYQYAIDTQDIGPGLTEYKFRKNNLPPAPDVTQTFENGTNVVVTGSETTVRLYGLQYDLHLDKVTLDAGNRTSGALANYTPGVQTNQIDEITRNLVDWWNHWIFWGSAYDGFTKDLGVLGICNYTGLTNITPTDTTLTSAGDVVKLVAEMENGLYESKIKKKGNVVQVHLSPKVYAKANSLLNTIGQSDLYFLQQRYGAENVMPNPYILEATSETTSTGAALVGIKLPAKYNKVVTPYPLAFYPKTSSDLGWDAKILVYGGVVLERPEAWCYESSLTVA
jgi:hypothetical protein